MARALRPTDEQQFAVDKFRTGRPVKIAAFAGSGKTTTLRMLGESRRARGLYLAFNKTIAGDAKASFPQSVECRTTHSLAFRAIMPQYRSSPKLTNSMQSRQLASVMGYTTKVVGRTLRLDAIHQGHLIRGTIARFCQSGDTSIGVGHVPQYGRLLGASKQTIDEVRMWAVMQAAFLWERMVNKNDDVPLGHDGYLKLWALGRPKIAAEYILLDEAQDTNGVVLSVLADQDAQVVYVGDRHQQIYEWRGAINAMETIGDCEEAFLTMSFRFGDAVAEGASAVLATLGEARRIRGNADIKSTILPAGRSRAVLARTNATVILEALAAISENKRPCVVGGTKELKRLVSDVYELKRGNPAISTEFFGFTNWRDVVDFSETEEGEGIRSFVQIVEQHGESKLYAAVTGAEEDELSSDVILSTAHKAKGREWDSVRLASDFVSSRLANPAEAASEVRLFYVAMTRAKQQLIVPPEVLSTFATDTWKTHKRQSRPSRSSATVATEPRAEPPRNAQLRQPPTSDSPRDAAPVREIIRPIVAAGHPGAAPSRDAQLRQPPTSDSPRDVAPIREIIRPTVAAGHPGAAPSRRTDSNKTETSANRPGLIARLRQLIGWR